MSINYTELVQLAMMSRSRAYAPYSNFKVGAYLIDINDECFYGCNVENASYSATICAERAAFMQAVATGARKFKAICIVGGINEINEFCYPCGVCLQFMSEFCDKDFEIIVATGAESEKYTLGELMPHSFSGKLI